MDAGALYTHFYCVTMHFLSTKNICISPIHRADLQDMSYPLAPIWEFAWGGGGRDKQEQGFHFFAFWDKEADLFLSLN